jgi:hypothetical protein
MMIRKIIFKREDSGVSFAEKGLNKFSTGAQILQG